jgi:cytochrome P450
MLLFADGVENVHAGIANAALALLDRPDQLARLREDPELAPRAADECLRFESPAQFVGRVAREGLALHGRDVKPEAPVLLMLGAANRDPERFPDPDELDVTRSPNPFLSFGRGRHSCVGAGLVRAEVAAALGALARLSRLEPAGSRPRWLPRPGHRWLEALPVTLRS